MTFKFKRYKIMHNGKSYYVMIPDRIKDNLWIVDWADWWYGSFVTGSLRAMKILAASFTVLGFNPYAIIYFPVGNDRIPNNLSGNPGNGRYDIVFKTNRIPLKDKDWKAIRNKLKKAKYTTYKFTYDEERVKRYFKQSVNYLNEVPQQKVLRNAGAGTWLSVGTAFFSFPKAWYQREAVDTWEWIKNVLSADDRSDNYNEEYDRFTCDMSYFCYGGYPKKKFTNEKPGCTFSVEMYDINIANRYLKQKDYFVENAKIRALENKVEGYNQFTYAGTNVLKIKIV